MTDDRPLVILGYESDTSGWAWAIAVVVLMWCAALVAAWAIAGSADASQEPVSARATIERLEKGRGFLIVPMTDADAYALEESIGSDVRVEVMR